MKRTRPFEGYVLNCGRLFFRQSAWLAGYHVNDRGIQVAFQGNLVNVTLAAACMVERGFKLV